jgi:hypothetical protein
VTVRAPSDLVPAGHGNHIASLHPVRRYVTQSGHLRLGEVGGLTAHFPDAGVGLMPPHADEVGDTSEPVWDIAVKRVAGLGVQPGGLHQLAVGVELELVDGAVADADRRRVAVTGEGSSCSCMRVPPSSR